MSSSERVELIACETCGSAQRDEHGRTRGEQLIARLRELSAITPEVRISSTRCLWACSRSCAVHVRSLDGTPRVGYVLGDGEPSEEFASALLAYAKDYAESSDGAVPFKRWPQALRGHFICRIPGV